LEGYSATIFAYG
jgi:hypothetical protein